MTRAAQKQRISPSAWARRRSCTTSLAAGAVRIMPTRSPGGLPHRQHRLGRDVAVVGQDRGDHVDRAGAAAQHVPVWPFTAMQAKTYSARASVG